jgi:hypothetical protein
MPACGTAVMVELTLDTQQSFELEARQTIPIASRVCLHDTLPSKVESSTVSYRR